MSGEHGDGLARSVWNAEAVRPRGLRGVLRGQGRLRPRRPDEPRQGRRRARPRRLPPDRPRLPRPRARVDRPRLLGAGRLRPRRGDVLGRRRLPEERRRDDVPELHGHARREAHHPRPRQRPPPGHDRRPCPPTAWPTTTLDEALDLCLQCKACKTECPSNVDMAKLKAEFLHQKYKIKPMPLGSLLMGHIHHLNPIGSATAPLANATLRNPAFKWLLEKVAGIDRRRTLPTFDSNHLRRWFRKHTPDARAGARGSVVLLDDCFTTYNSPDVGRAAVRVLEAGGYRVELAGLPCCGRPAISKGLLTLGRDLARENVATAGRPGQAGIADPRLRAELPAHAGRRIPRLPPRPRRRPRRVRRRSWSTPSSPTASAMPDLPLTPWPGQGPAPRPLPAEGPGRHGRDGRRAEANRRVWR